MGPLILTVGVLCDILELYFYSDDSRKHIYKHILDNVILIQHLYCV